MESMNAPAKQTRFSAFNPGLKPKLTLAPDSALFLAILDKMQDYDVLYSSYVKSLFPSEAYIEDRLTELQKGHYIGVPQNWAHPKKLHRERPLEVWPRGFSYLGERRRAHQRGNDHVNHKLLRSTLEFHADRLPGEVTRLPIETYSLSATRTFTPDNTWKIVYREVSDATMVFHQEDDTGSERVRGNKRFEARKKTVRVMLQNYVTYFELGLYAPLFPAVSVLIHTTKTSRVDTILDLIAEEVPAKWQNRFNVKAVPDFIAEPLLLPAPSENVLATDYTRIVNGERKRFNIVEILKATEQRKRGGGISGR